MARGLMRNMPINCSVCSSACTAARSSRARASVWRTSSALFTGTAAGRGRRARWTTARHSIFQSRTKTKASMQTESRIIQNILLVEDDLRDVDLTLAALADHHLSNKVFVVHDGAE